MLEDTGADKWAADINYMATAMTEIENYEILHCPRHLCSVSSRVSPAVLRRHPSDVHERGIPQLLPHRAVGERLQHPAHPAAAALQLDQGRNHLPERATICLGKFILVLSSLSQPICIVLLSLNEKVSPVVPMGTQYGSKTSLCSFLLLLLPGPQPSHLRPGHPWHRDPGAAELRHRGQVGAREAQGEGHPHHPGQLQRDLGGRDLLRGLQVNIK